jgi:hypothetical protein
MLNPASDPSASPLAGIRPALTAPQLAAIGQLADGQSISAAARIAGVHRGTVHRWINEHPDFRAAYEHVRAQMLDATQSRLLTLADKAITTIGKAIKRGDVTVSMNLVKSLGLLAPPAPDPQTR